MDTGELVPDEIVIRVVDEHFAAGGPLDDGFILDGFPRTLVQAEELEQVLSDHPLDLVLDIEVPTEIDPRPHRRAAGLRELRRHLPREPAPPTVDWTCDVCGGDGRAARRRHRGGRRHAGSRSTTAQTVPIIDFYAEPRQARRGRRRRRRRRGPRAPGQGDRRALRAPTTVITRKNREQIALMRRAGKVVAEMHEVCTRAAKPGATTLDVDAAAREVLDRRGARSNFLGYHGVPGGRVHLAERRDRARDPERRRRARRGRHPLDRLRGDHRGLARRRRGHGAGR